MTRQAWLHVAESMTSSSGIHLSNYQRAEEHAAAKPDDVLGWALRAAGLPDDNHHRVALVLRARYHNPQTAKERS